MNAAVSAVSAVSHSPAASPAQVIQLADGRRYEILHKRLSDGAREAGAVIESLHRDLPSDQLAKVDALAISAGPTGLVVGVGSDTLSTSNYALSQIADKAGIPADHLRKLATSEDDWRRELAAHDVRTILSHAPSGQRALLRSVRGQLRGFLSDKFRRLDCRPLADALAQEANAIGAVPFGGSVTETRCALKVVFPQVLTVKGDPVLVGCEWSNSDYGNGTNSIRTFLLRVLCLNGATGENLLRQVHLGGRLDENIEFSQGTYQLDTRASVSALRDVVRGVLGPAGREKLTTRIAEAAERPTSAGQLAAQLKNEPKATQKLIVDAFKSADTINLPPGDTAWRASNAISWIAKSTDDAERRLDLERLAGSVL